MADEPITRPLVGRPRDYELSGHRTGATRSGANWPTVAVAFGSLLIQFGTIVWWGRGIDAKVQEHDEYIKLQKATDSQMRVDVEVTRSEVKGIKAAVERIEQKIDGRHP